MALPAGGVIEIRASATAGNLNGGGFNSARSGTDYTLQDAAQLTQTDGTAAGTTTFTSVAGGFTDAMKGNYLHITAATGLTVGWYEIVSVTDASNVVLDRTPGTGSAATFYVGGAMSLNSTLDDELFEIGVAGNKFYIKNGTYTLGEAVSVAAAGGAQNPIRIIGYNSTRDDNPTGSTRPTINGGANTFSVGTAWHVGYVIFTGTAAAVFSSGSGSVIRNVKAINKSTTADRDAFEARTDTMFFACEGISYRGKALHVNAISYVFVVGCWLHESVNGIGISGADSPRYHVLNTIISSCVTSAVAHSGGSHANRFLFSECTFFGSTNTTGTGLTFGSSMTTITIINCIITGFVTGVTHGANDLAGFDDFNNYHNNDTNVSNWTQGPNNVAIAPTFTNVGQVTGTAGKYAAGNDRIIDTTKDFTSLGVVAGQDCIYIISGTGVTAGIYGISSIATTTNPNDTLVLDIAPGTNTTADKTYQITTGHNFLPTGAF